MQRFEFLISDLFFNSSTSMSFIALRSKQLSKSFNVIYRFEPPYAILVLTSNGQMHRLIPHADAVDLAFYLHLHIQAANAVMCLMTYFYMLA